MLRDYVSLFSSFLRYFQVILDLFMASNGDIPGQSIKTCTQITQDRVWIS